MHAICTGYHNFNCFISLNLFRLFFHGWSQLRYRLAMFTLLTYKRSNYFLVAEKVVYKQFPRIWRALPLNTCWLLFLPHDVTYNRYVVWGKCCLHHGLGQFLCSCGATRPVFHRSELGPLPKGVARRKIEIIDNWKLSPLLGSGPDSDLWKTGRV